MKYLSCIRASGLVLGCTALLAPGARGQITCAPTAVNAHLGGCTEEVVVSVGSSGVLVTATTIPPGVSVSPTGTLTNGAGEASFAVGCTAVGGPAAVVFTSGLSTCATSVTCLPQVVAYCTAGTTAFSCVVNLNWTGTPSATAGFGFDVTGQNAPGSTVGLFFFGTNGRQSMPWGNSSSFMCVVPPVKRSSVWDSGGSLGNCDGSFVLALNTLWLLKPAKNPGAGSVVQMQAWFRDPQNTSNTKTSMSNALEFCVDP